MAEPDDDPTEDSGLNERLLDVFVFLPVGVAVSVVEELPGWRHAAESGSVSGCPRHGPWASSR